MLDQVGVYVFPYKHRLRDVYGRRGERKVIGGKAVALPQPPHAPRGARKEERTTTTDLNSRTICIETRSDNMKITAGRKYSIIVIYGSSR